MNEVITISELLKFAGIIVGTWGFVKIIMEIVKAINERHDREQRWDESATAIVEERQRIVDRYDARLAEMEKKIDDNHTDTESKLQQIRAEQYMLTVCMNAVLDGLQQLNCNGNVTKAKKDLEDYLTSQAYGVKR